MSGGALEYAYHRVEETANRIHEFLNQPDIKEFYTDKSISLHKKFADFLYDVSEALHDLEWVYSGDCAEGVEVKAINRVLRGI